MRRRSSLVQLAGAGCRQSAVGHSCCCCCWLGGLCAAANNAQRGRAGGRAGPLTGLGWCRRRRRPFPTKVRLLLLLLAYSQIAATSALSSLGPLWLISPTPLSVAFGFSPSLWQAALCSWVGRGLLQARNCKEEKKPERAKSDQKDRLPPRLRSEQSLR